MLTAGDPFSFEDDGDGARKSVRASKGQRASEMQKMELEGRLNFTQRIVATAASKAIPTNELVKRLKDLHSQLSQLEQEEVDKSSLQVVRKDLVSRSLFMHKDKAVRILTACCLADILRLFAPDAPYNQSDLRIHNITDTQGPFFENYFYLLESLSTVKSIVLVSDINAEELVTQIFRDFFDIVWPDMQKNLYGFILDILQQLIEECPVLNHEVIEIIMKSFSNKKTPENLPAFQLAVDLCKNAGDRLQRYVCQYFGDLFVSAAKEDVETSEFEAAHNLILEINAHAKGVLLNVIPLLEEELRYEIVDIRLLATELLGKMISEPGSTLAKTYPTTFRTWLERRNDKQIAIRIQWLEYCLEVFRNQPELIHEVSIGLEEKLQDPDDKVRFVAVKIFTHVDANMVSFITKDILLRLSDRCKDKKPLIRTEAIASLSRLYKIMFDKMQENAQVEDKVAWIPGHILETLFLDDAETKISVEKALVEDIFPVNMDDFARTERLLKIVSALNEKQYPAFLSVLDRQAQTIKAVKAFVEHSEKWNSGIMDTPDPSIETTINKLTQYLVARLPDPKKSSVHLLKFAKANENRTYKLLASILDEKADYKTILKCNKELYKRLEALGVMETFSIILRRVSLTILGRSSIPCLLEAAREAKKVASETDNVKGEMRSTADTVIKDMASKLPGVFRSHMSELLNVLETNDVSLVSEALEALSRFVKMSPSDIDLSSEALETLKTYALEGRQRQAKNAAKLIAILGFSSAKEELLDAIVASLTIKNLEAALKHDSNPQMVDPEMEALKTGLAAKLISLGQFALYSSADFERYHIPIVNFVVKELLLKSRSSTDIHGEEDWIGWDDLGAEGVYKVLGLRLLAKRIQGLAQRKSSNFRDVSRPILKLLNVIIEHDGEVSPEPPRRTSPAFRSHLRLSSALLLLKLSKIPEFDELTTMEDFCRLSLTIQDQAWQVRDSFVDKLRKYLQIKAVPFRFLVFLMMAAHEPDQEMKRKVDTTSSQRAPIEHEFPTLLFAIAHHPDFAFSETADIDTSAKYIKFVLEAIASQENSSLIFHLCAQMKTLKDIHAQSFEGIYHLSDLAQALIQDHCNQHGWSLLSYPSTLPFNKRIFEKLPESLGADNLKRSYLSKEWVSLRIKQSHTNKAKPSMQGPSANATKGPGSAKKETRKDKAEAVKAKQGKTKGTAGKRKSLDDDDDEAPVKRLARGDDDVTPRRVSAPRSAKSKALKYRNDSGGESDFDSKADKDLEEEEEDYDNSAPASPTKKLKLHNSTKGRKGRVIEKLKDLERDSESEEEVPERLKSRRGKPKGVRKENDPDQNSESEVELKRKTTASQLKEKTKLKNSEAEVDVDAGKEVRRKTDTGRGKGKAASMTKECEAESDRDDVEVLKKVMGKEDAGSDADEVPLLKRKTRQQVSRDKKKASNSSTVPDEMEVEPTTSSGSSAPVADVVMTDTNAKRGRPRRGD
ncbi:hypothetical protein HDU67_009756 [Dinochytrium kinnereticum]|nr:hypothetical protein HDU67_009756 [Dinochytrium kinnereticum]